MRTAVREDGRSASPRIVTLPLNREAQRGGRVKVRLVRSAENVFKIFMNEESEHEFRLDENQTLNFDYVFPTASASSSQFKNGARAKSRSSSRQPSADWIRNRSASSRVGLTSCYVPPLHQNIHTARSYVSPRPSTSP